MGVNKILKFAETDTTTNLLTDTEYAADAQRPIGNQPGIARSKLMNKALRQGSLIAASIAKFLADKQANDITDSLSETTIAGYLVNVLGKDAQNATYNSAVAAGTADALTAAFVPAVAALANGMTLFVRAGFANTTTTPTFKADGTTAKPIVKGNNLSLLASDILGAGQWIMLQYDSVLDKWVLLNPATGIFPPSVPTQSAFKNLKIVASGLTNTSAVLTADEVALENSTGQYFTAKNLNLTINSAASGANGLDTGTPAINSWLSVWVIYNPTTLTAAGLLSLSPTAPTLPAGYTYKSRLGWVRTDGTANKYLLQTLQYGREVQYIVTAGSNTPNMPIAASGAAGSPTTPTYIAVGINSLVPTTASTINGVLGGGVNSLVIVAPNPAYGGLGSVSNPPSVGVNMVSTGSALDTPFKILLESSNIYWASGTSNGVIGIQGWIDNI